MTAGKFRDLASLFALAMMLYGMNSPAHGSCQPTVSVNNKPCTGGTLTQPHFEVNNRCDCPVTVTILDSDKKSHLVTRKAGESREGSYVSTCRRRPLTIQTWNAEFTCPAGRRNSAIVQPARPRASPDTSTPSQSPQEVSSSPKPNQPPEAASSGPTRQQMKAYMDCISSYAARVEVQNATCLTLLQRRVPDAQVQACGREGQRLGEEAGRTCGPLLTN
jgi:hypothetical protein